MDIRRDLIAQCVFSHLSPPALSPTQKDSLIAAKAVEHQGVAGAKGGMIGIERHQESTEIGNVLTQSLTAVDMKSRQYFIAIELMRQSLGLLLEMLGIGGSPPVMQPPDCVNFAALIVKPVDDFVANDRADGAIA